MAQQLLTLEIDRQVLERVYINEVRTILETVASPIGVGSDAPYIGVYVELETRTGVAQDLGSAGSFRLQIGYTNATSSNLVQDDAPFSVSGAIPTASGWFVIRGDGKFYPVANAPTAATVVAQSASAASRERLAYSASLTPSFHSGWLAEGA